MSIDKTICYDCGEIFSEILILYQCPDCGSEDIGEYEPLPDDTLYERN